MAWRFYTPVLRKRRKLTVYEQADEYRRLLLEGDARAARRIKAAYSDIARQLDRDLKALAKRIEQARKAGLDERVSWQLEQARIIELLGRVRKQIDGFAAIASGVTGDRQGELAGLGQTHAASLAKSAGITSGFRQLNQGQLTDLIGHLEDGSPLADLFREIAPRAISHARSVFARAAATGANPRATARVLAREVQGLTETRALLIARTETLRSYRTSTQRAFKANSDVVTGWRWMAAKNSRTCPMCLAMDGSVHSVDEVLVSHPACRCAQIPITEYSSPPPETGEVWFSKQPDEVKKEILGPSKFALYQRGELKLPDLVANTTHPRWGKGRQEATLAEAIANAKARMAIEPIPRAAQDPDAPRLPGMERSTIRPSQYQGAASGSLVNPTKGNGRIISRVQHGIEVIDFVHGYGEAPLSRFKIPIVYTSKLPPGVEGEFVPILRGRRSGTPIEIRINASGVHPEYTIAHEFGHFVDFVGHSGQPLLGGMSGNGADLMEGMDQLWDDFFNTAAATPQLQALLHAEETGLLPWDDVVYDMRDPDSYAQVKYLLRPWELWARSYAQFVGKRGNSLAIQTQISDLRNSKYVTRAVSQWNEEEFAGIEVAVESILRKLGMLK